MVGVYADGIIVVVGRKILLDLQELRTIVDVVGSVTVIVVVEAFVEAEVHMVGVFANGIIVVVGRKILLDLQELHTIVDVAGSVTVIVVGEAFVRGVVVYIEGVGGT